jgi:hypothetical protein
MSCGRTKNFAAAQARTLDAKLSTIAYGTHTEVWIITAKGRPHANRLMCHDNGGIAIRVSLYDIDTQCRGCWRRS